jgi:hypothetical protein
MAKLRTVDNEENPLARNLAAAFIATCHGIGLDYARKKYAGECSAVRPAQQYSRW